MIINYYEQRKYLKLFKKLFSIITIFVPLFYKLIFILINDDQYLALRVLILIFRFVLIRNIDELF